VVEDGLASRADGLHSGETGGLRTGRFRAAANVSCHSFMRWGRHLERVSVVD
jgi:hypothetical protein